MRMYQIAAACLSVAALLGACSKPAEDKAAPATAQTPEQTAAGMKMRPGQWRTTIQILEVNMPGAPAGIAESMKGKPIVDEACVDADDVQDFVSKKAVKEEDSGMKCAVNSMNVAAGTIKGDTSCTTKDGGTQTMQMAGTYNSDRVEMTMNMSMTMPMGQMSQKMRMLSERIGECPK